MAVGLGTMDMPVPSVVEWEWLNWKFPRPVHSGDTIYARWTLTQKRPPAAGATASIVVWRVDLHTSDGAMCAEGEVGAKVRRHAAALAPKQRTPEAAEAGSQGATAVPSSARRRRRRRPAGNGNGPEQPAIPAPPAVAAAKPADRAPAAPRSRRRRRRPAGSTSGPRDGESAPSAAPPETPTAQPSPSTAKPAVPKSGLSRVIGRLRGS
ncbi:MAG TPA: MaoC family dehydratase [Candidatus Dormibacteraeota bacterium]|jgi:hypothetical protein